MADAGEWVAGRQCRGVRRGRIVQLTGDQALIVEERFGYTWTFERSALPEDVPQEVGALVMIEVWRDVTCRSRRPDDPRAGWPAR